MVQDIMSLCINSFHMQNDIVRGGTCETTQDPMSSLVRTFSCCVGL